MAWYGQKNYNDRLGGGALTIAQVGCFLTAFCNLEQRFGKDIDPSSLNRLFIQRGVFLADPSDGSHDELGWNSMTAYDGQLHTTNINNNAAGAWPSSPNSIVKFAFNSPKTGVPTTHFCLVADPSAHTIIDSWDGIIRSPGYYGHPVAFAEYAETTPEPVHVAAVVPANNADGALVKLQAGDTISAVALRYGFTAQELLDHNGLTWSDARALPIGYSIHLPVKQAPAQVDQAIQYEVLNPARQMHVSKTPGAEKWAFGNAKNFADCVNTGTTPVNTNVTIVGVAKVLLSGEATAYYMEASNFGDYAVSGKVVNTIGFNWSDVADGWIDNPAPQPAADTYTVKKGDSLWNICGQLLNTNNAADIKAKVQEIARINSLLDPRLIQPGQVLKLKADPAPVAAPAPIPDVKPATPTPQPAPAVVPEAASPNAYKASYKAFDSPKMFIAINSIMCKEYDGRRPDHQLLKNQAVSISGTFIFGQTLLGRPAGAVKAGYWFGVPMDNLMAEAELYNTKVDLPTKVAIHAALTLGERVVIVVASAIGVLRKLTLNREKKD